jgi:Acyl-protein synthetase, LuxE
MSSTSNLSGFAARLRRFIKASTSAPAANAGDFDAIALELFALQFQHNAAYRRLCEARGASPDAVAHWAAIPAAPTSAFKEFALTCLPQAERTTVFHSSGTTVHRPSRHYHNAESLVLYEASLLKWFGANFKLPLSSLTMAMLTPPPASAPHSSLVHMFETIRRECRQPGAVYLGRAVAEGGWALDLEAALEWLSKASAANEPLLILGTAFSFVHLLDYLTERRLRFGLPPGSCVLETGGYKSRSRSLPQAALHALISQRLGIPSHCIICEYGMSELSSQAYDCSVGSSRNTQHATHPFHFPPWTRVQIVSPETGREVGEGETGLIRVFDLANVYSVMAIQTEDLGTRYGDGFALAGRAALAEPRGCSLMVA